MPNDMTPAIVPASDAPMVAMIERVVMDPNVPLDRLEKMLDMKEQIDRKAAERAFAAAFAAASAEIPSIPLNGKGNNNKPYALLRDIVAYTRPHLSAHGLVLAFDVQASEKSMKVTAVLSHRDGHSRSTSIVLPTDTSGSKNAVQAFGSTQTYGQRYTAQALLGLSLGDDAEDDGRGAAPAGNEPITETQWREITALIERAGIAESVVLAAEKLSDLVDLPAKRFDAVKARLQKTIQTKGAQ